MKKFLAVLLSVLMVLSVAPVAFAQNADAETTTVAGNADASDESLADAGNLFGGMFIRLGELLQIIFNFLSNLFNGTGDTNIDFM